MVGALGIEPRKTEPGCDSVGAGLAEQRGRSDERRRQGVVGALGIEPRTNGLKGHCSTAELYPHRNRGFADANNATATYRFAANRHRLRPRIIPEARQITNRAGGDDLTRPGTGSGLRHQPTQSRPRGAGRHRSDRRPPRWHRPCNRTRWPHSRLRAAARSR